jgi:hypothetical protein
MKRRLCLQRGVVIVLLLVGATSCATPGGAIRDGKTFVRATNGVVSYEVYRVTGVGVGDGWNIIWVGGDEFAYCVSADHRSWIDDLDRGLRAKRDVVISYQDGGGWTTGACSTGVEGVHKVLVTNIEGLE